MPDRRIYAADPRDASWRMVRRASHSALLLKPTNFTSRQPVKLPIIIAALCCSCPGTAWSAVTYTLGTPSSTRIGASTTGLGDSSSHGAASGSFNTSAPGGSSGVSFDLTIAAYRGSDAATVGTQSGGLGVFGGRVDAGIDNNNEALEAIATDLEGITLSLSNVTGLAPGEELMVSEVVLSFGINGGETYTLDGSGDLSFTSSPESIAVNSPSVSIAAGTAGDTRFVISSMTVAVVPEPSVLLLCLGTLPMWMLRRR